MHRKPLLQVLQNYPYSNENQALTRFIAFVKSNPNCFDRSLKIGHVTGSAFVISKDHRKILLTLHKKLNKWLQLGGHADGETLIHKVAYKEAVEESGIQNLILVSASQNHPHMPFDIDIHTIPKYLQQEAHDHFDVRYIFIAEHEDFVCSSESKELRWFSFFEVFENLKSHSLQRACKKIKTFFP